jgi:hypothetical protein
MNVNAMTHEAPSPLPAPIFFPSNVANSFSEKTKIIWTLSFVNLPSVILYMEEKEETGLLENGLVT